MSISKDRKKEIILTYGEGEKNSGSVEVQCALLTNRINSLTTHMKAHKKDFSSRRGLLIMVNQRKKLLEYLSKKFNDRYKKLISSLGIRK